jgi:hypothetical protein
MAQRRWGPSRAAGTVIVEKEGKKTIEAAPYGVVGYAGILEKGAIGELIDVGGKEALIRKTGGYIADSYLPDSARHFWDLSGGAGRMYLVRVTDGNEVAASLTLLSRHRPRVEVVKVEAKNAGRWGGKRKLVVGDITGGGDLTDTTIDTGLTMLKDEWKGGTLYMTELSGKSYSILGNTTAGVVTLASWSKLETEWTESGGGDTEFALELANGGKQVAVVVKNGALDPDSEWGLEVYVDGLFRLDFPDLSMDPSSQRYFVDVINESTSNEEIEVTNLYTGEVTADARPANHAGMIGAGYLAATSLAMDVFEVTYKDGNTGDGKVYDFVIGNTAWPDKLTLVCTNAGPPAVFSVDSQLQDHALPNATAESAYTEDNEWTVGFTVGVGATGWAVGDEIYIYVRSLVTDEAIGGSIYPDRVNDKYKKYEVIDNDRYSVTTRAGTDMTDEGTEAERGEVTGGTVSFPVTITGSVNDEFKFKIDGGKEQTVTLTAGARSQQQIIDEINSEGWGIIASAVGTDKIKVASYSWGASAVMLVTAGSANSTLGFSDTTSDAGADGDLYRLEYQQQLAGGYDGIAELADADWEAVWNTTTSLFNQVEGENQGLLKLAMPGQTSTTPVKAMDAYAEAKNHQSRNEIPSNVTTDEAALAHIQDTLGRNDFKVVSFPSWIYVSNPEGAGVKLVPATGMIHGAEARVAHDHEGYGKPEAGVQVKLPAIVKLPTGNRRLNEELLNPAGIGVIKKSKGNWILWGDRIPYVDPTWKWKHQRETLSYYEHILAENFDWLIFEINDKSLHPLVKAALVDFFYPEWNRKRFLRGDTFEKACHIKVDEEINTDATRAAGDYYAEISLQIADAVERAVFVVNKNGIFEQAG